MYIIFLFLYGLTALVNILSIHYERPTIRIVSKICLMPTLVLFFVFKSDSFSFTIILAIIFSWFGDILLVKPKKLGLYAGIFSFLAAHISYTLAFIDLVPGINIIVLIVSFLFVLSLERLLLKKFHIQNNYKIFAIIYGIVIDFLVVSSLQVFIWYKNISGFFLVIGSISFFISDTLLVCFNTIKTMIKNSFMGIMLTYTIAQVCIVIGYVLK
jgi:uncharacterized membrane protein YhhN